MLRFIVFSFIAIVLLGCHSNVMAQGGEDFSKSKFVVSSGVYIGGCYLDYRSSIGHREGNILLRDSNGRFSRNKYIALNGGIYGLSLLLDKWSGRGGHILRYVAGSVHFSVGIRNYDLVNRGR